MKKKFFFHSSLPFSTACFDILLELTVDVTSVQERGQPVGIGAGQVQPGERISAGGSHGGAGRLCNDAGGGTAPLLQRSHGPLQNRSIIVLLHRY